MHFNGFLLRQSLHSSTHDSQHSCIEPTEAGPIYNALSTHFIALIWPRRDFIAFHIFSSSLFRQGTIHIGWPQKFRPFVYFYPRFMYTFGAPINQHPTEDVTGDFLCTEGRWTISWKARVVVKPTFTFVAHHRRRPRVIGKQNVGWGIVTASAISISYNDNGDGGQNLEVLQMWCMKDPPLTTHTLHRKSDPLLCWCVYISLLLSDRQQCRTLIVTRRTTKQSKMETTKMFSLALVVVCAIIGIANARES